MCAHNACVPVSIDLTRVVTVSDGRMQLTGNKRAAGALEKLEIVSAPSAGQTTVLEAVRAGLRGAQVALEGGQVGLLCRCDLHCMLDPHQHRASVCKQCKTGFPSSLPMTASTCFWMCHVRLGRPEECSAQPRLRVFVLWQASAFGAAAMGDGRRARGQTVVASLCPLHGPVVQSAATELIYKYRQPVDLPANRGYGISVGH